MKRDVQKDVKGELTKCATAGWTRVVMGMVEQAAKDARPFDMHLAHLLWRFYDAASDVEAYCVAKEGVA